MVLCDFTFAGVGLQPGPYVSSIEERSNCKVRKIQKSKKRRVQFTKLNPHLKNACCGGDVTYGRI